MVKNKYERLIALSLNIAFFRRKKGLTQEKLAEIIGISRTHMSNIEAVNVEKLPSLEVLIDIVDALDVDFNKLFEIR